MTHIDRRTFLTASAASAAALSMAAPAARAAPRRGASGNAGPIAISSGNGRRAVQRAADLMREGADPLDAAVQGVQIVETDPNDMSVGYGGLPNEDGVVELDASVMHGPTHKAGAVAALRNIKTPAAVALDVCRRTDHVMLVGAGALEFARALGYPEENLLTPKAREAWLRWKSNLNPRDDWLDDDQRLRPTGTQAKVEDEGPIPFTYGTIHCSALDAKGDLGSCTTTSGLSFKLPGRVGDSPIIGAGMFCDNTVGAAGATGRGESVIQSCGAFQAVQHMANGDDPETACLKVLKWIADHTKRHDLLDDQGRPNFNVVMYALRKDGAYGSACMLGKRSYAVHDGSGTQLRSCASLFP